MDKTLARQRILQALLWGGGLLTVGGLLLLALPIPLKAGLLIGPGLMLLGANTLIGGDITAGREIRSFTARGAVVRGKIEVRSAWNSFQMESCAGDRIATMRYGPFGEPDFTLAEGIAYLRFIHSFPQPNLATWQVEVANNILWEMDVRSTVGDLQLDLQNLRVDQVTARTGSGEITVICPERGYLQMKLETRIGRVKIVIPEGTGVRLHYQRGSLDHLVIDNERVQKTNRPDIYITQGYDEASAQVDIIIESWAGDILLL